MKQFWPVVFFLFLYSGSLKLAFQLAGIPMPIDVTLLFAVLLLLKSVAICFTENKTGTGSLLPVPGLILLAAFFALSFISLSYTPSPDFSVRKLSLSTLNIVAFIFPLCYRELDLRKALRFVVLYSVFVFLLVFYSIQVRWMGQSELFSGIETDIMENVKNAYLTSGMLLGISVILLEFSGYRLRTLFQVLCLAAIFLVGSRGPLLFTLLLFVFLKLRNAKGQGMLMRLLLLSFVSLLLVSVSDLSFLDSGNIGRSLDRFMLLFASGGDSVNERVRMLDFAFNGIFGNNTSLFTFLFGHGIGSFGILFSGSDGRLYPHNIFLEVFFETGLAGVVFFSALIGYCLRRMPHNVYVYLSLFVLLNCLKSYTLEDIRFLFGFLSLTLAHGIVAVRNETTSASFINKNYLFRLSGSK